MLFHIATGAPLWWEAANSMCHYLFLYFCPVCSVIHDHQTAARMFTPVTANSKPRENFRWEFTLGQGGAAWYKDAPTMGRRCAIILFEAREGSLEKLRDVPSASQKTSSRAGGCDSKASGFHSVVFMVQHKDVSCRVRVGLDRLIQT